MDPWKVVLKLLFIEENKMRVIEIIKPFKHNDKVSYKSGQRLIMAEDIESQFRSLYPDCIGMSYPIETIYRKYQGQDLNGKKLMTWRTGGIGDLFFLNPVLRYLKKRYPKSFIRVATGCRQPLENVPEIDELYDMPFDALLMDEVDYHLMFQGIIEGSSEISKRTHAVDMFFSYFNIDSTHFSAEEKRPRLFFTEKEFEWLNNKIKELGIKEDDYVIGFQMETSSPLRNYPKERMKKVIDILSQEQKTKIVLIGTPQHNIIGQFYKSGKNNIIIATEFNIRESIILANRYDLIISPDTFMVQVAGALDKPLIGLYGPFPSEVRMKYFKNAIGLDADVVCSPCYKHDFRGCVKGYPSPCFSQIKPEDILQAIDYLKHEHTGNHFKFMKEVLKDPDLSEIEKYMLSADKGLSFFGGYYKHPNIIRVDKNKFVKADITDLNVEFRRAFYPFVLYIGPSGFLPENRPIYDNAKSLIRPGGYFIIHMMNSGMIDFFEEVKQDMGSSGFILLYAKYNPDQSSFTIVGRKPY